MMKIQAFALYMSTVLLLTMATAYGDDNAVAIEVTGKNINLIKTLCGDDAPAADVNALKVTEIKDANGNVIEGYDGKILHYLPAPAAARLMKGNIGSDTVVTVKGTLYKNAHAIMVLEFELHVAAESDGVGLDDWNNWDEYGITTTSGKQII